MATNGSTTRLQPYVKRTQHCARIPIGAAADRTVHSHPRPGPCLGNSDTSHINSSSHRIQIEWKKPRTRLQEFACPCRARAHVEWYLPKTGILIGRSGACTCTSVGG